MKAPTYKFITSLLKNIIPFLRYWWQHSFAKQIWSRLTPTGRWLFWLPWTMVVYLAVLLGLLMLLVLVPILLALAAWVWVYETFLATLFSNLMQMIFANNDATHFRNRL